MSHIDSNQAQILNSTMNLEAYINGLLEFVEANSINSQVDRTNFDLLLNAQDFF